MITITEKYDSLKIDRIKKMIQLQQATGRMMCYDIQIDQVKLIPKTTDLSLFDAHEQFIDNSVRTIDITVYPHEKAVAEKKYSFILVHSANGLDGFSDSRMEHLLEKEKWEVTRKEEKIQELTGKLQEAEDHISELEAEIEEKDQKISSQNEFGKISDTLTTLVIPRIFPESTPTPPPLTGAPGKQAEASFSAADANEEILSTAEKNQLALLRHMQQNLSPQQLKDFQFLLNHFKNQPQHLSQFVSLIQQSNNKS